MIKDALGNTIEQGNLVVCIVKDHIPPIGRVLLLKPGGVAMPGSNKLTPTIMVVGFEMTVTVDSEKDVAVGALVRIVDPNAEAVVNKLLEMPAPKV